MSATRLAVQHAVKKLARSLGIEIRYAFQNPTITSAKIYAPWLSTDQVTCIFDVGANVGQSARGFVRVFPRSTVHCFEPFPGAYWRLEQLAKSYRGRVKAYQLACGDAEGYIDVAVDPFSGSPLNQLCSEPNRRPLPGEQAIRIQIRTIDEICEHEGVGVIDILKTDTEGYDAKVLTGAKRMLSTGGARCVISEVGFMEDGQHTEFAKVFSLLHQLGFEMVGFYETSYLPSGRCDFANALFVSRHLL
jgi:FkbM family methyltransferase